MAASEVLELDAGLRDAAEAAPGRGEFFIVRRGPMAGPQVASAVAGFELVSCAMPARASGVANQMQGPHRFAGDAELGQDIRIALSPFLAEMPVGAALAVEYVFTPVGEGGVGVRVRMLVESALLEPTKAQEQAAALRDELALCLRVLADWYAFRPARFEAADRMRWSSRKLCVRVQPRLFAEQADGRVGFTPAARRGHRARLLMPQPVAGDAHLREPSAGALRLHASGVGTLLHCIRAARGLTRELSVRVTLRRKDVAEADQHALRDLAGRASAAMHGELADAGSAQLTGVAAAAALEAVQALLAQPECLAVEIQSSAVGHGERAWLRLLWQELFPGFASELVAGGARPARSEAARQGPIDISQLLATGLAPPPLLPAPPVMESIGFARHHANPAVLFPDGGLLLGQAQIGGVLVDVRMPHADRSRHTYVLGATGTGKSTLLFNMMVQDMAAGHGMALLDPHGDLFEQVLAAVPPHRRADLRVIDIDDERFCPCLNPLDLGVQAGAVAVNRVANDLLDIFGRLYDMETAGGPVFEEFFRHALLLAAAGPSGGPFPGDGPVPTFASVTHVLRNKAWRLRCMERLQETYGDAAAPMRQFIESAEMVRGDHAFENLQGYITSKLTRFVTSATLHRLFCTGRRTLDFRTLMDERSILLVNLSKGDLGRGDARLVGMLLTKYIYQAALSRSDVAREQRQPFHFYLDEFQNFVASDVPEMLAEARKYGLHLTLANQTLGQLSGQGQREALDAVLGNAATRLFFRLGQEEAAVVESSFAPHFDRHTLLQLADRQVLCRLLIDNQPSLPFVFGTLPATESHGGAVAALARKWAAENLGIGANAHPGGPAA